MRQPVGARRPLRRQDAGRNHARPNRLLSCYRAGLEIGGDRCSISSRSSSASSPCFVAVVAFIPLLGWANWLIIPLAVIGAGVGMASSSNSRPQPQPVRDRRRHRPADARRRHPVKPPTRAIDAYIAKAAAVRPADPRACPRARPRRRPGRRGDAQMERAGLHHRRQDPADHGRLQGACGAQFLARAGDSRRRGRADAMGQFGKLTSRRRPAARRRARRLIREAAELAADRARAAQGQARAQAAARAASRIRGRARGKRPRPRRRSTASRPAPGATISTGSPRRSRTRPAPSASPPRSNGSAKARGGTGSIRIADA